MLPPLAADKDDVGVVVEPFTPGGGRCCCCSDDADAAASPVPECALACTVAATGLSVTLSMATALRMLVEVLPAVIPTVPGGGSVALKSDDDAVGITGCTCSCDFAVKDFIWSPLRAPFSRDAPGGEAAPLDSAEAGSEGSSLAFAQAPPILSGQVFERLPPSLLCLKRAAPLLCSPRKAFYADGRKTRSQTARKDILCCNRTRSAFYRNDEVPPSTL